TAVKIDGATSHPVAKGRQFEQRQIEAASVKGHELHARMLFQVRSDAGPELLHDVARSEVRRAQRRDPLQAIIRADANDPHRDRDSDRNLDKVGTAARLLARFSLSAANGLFWPQVLVAILDLAKKPAIRHALGVQQ